MYSRQSNLQLCLLLSSTCIKWAYTLDFFLLAGGQRLSQVETSGSCPTLIPDVPFMTKGAIGLINKDGRPMICGGQDNPDQKSCVTYLSGEWENSEATLNVGRNGAVTIKAGTTGDWWIFGGKKAIPTEYYNSTSGTFIEGPKSPLGGRVGICGAYSEKYEKIFLTGWRGKPNSNSVYMFDPVLKTFEKLPELPENKKRMSCGIATDSEGDDVFVVTGGFSKFRNASATTFILDIPDQTWSTGPDYPTKIYGAASLNLNGRFIVMGGATDEHLTKDSYAFNVNEDDEFEWEFVGQIEKKRRYPVVIVGKQDNIC